MIFLMPIYFIIAVLVIYTLMKKYQGQHKWRRFLLLAFLFYLPVGWDVTLGRTYFHYLCNKDGGIHIYEQVELDPEHWDKNGNPKFYTENEPYKKGSFDPGYFQGKYKYDFIRDKSFTTIFNIIRRKWQVTDVLAEKVIAEKVGYLYWGGWVMNAWQPFSGGERLACPKINKVSDDAFSNDYKQLISHVFINNTKKDSKL